MGERKVLNKYYPPDFDPKKLPKLELGKNFQCVIRTMAPFTMRCLTCGNYVYKGKKFNARKETVEDEDYIGIRIHRFYIRCPVCLTEIIFKTDPKNTDYAVETGAYRTFQAEHLAELEEERLKEEKEEDEANNPMLALENRTKESRREMDVIDALEDIRDWNARKAGVKFEDLMDRHILLEKQEAERQEQEDEAIVNKMFSRKSEIVKRLEDIEDDPPASKVPKLEDVLPSATPSVPKKVSDSCQRKGVASKLAGLVIVKTKTNEKSAPSDCKTIPVATKTLSNPGSHLKGEDSSPVPKAKEDGDGVSSLGLLGAYSGDSSSDGEEN